jgi:ferredoxin
MPNGGQISFGKRATGLCEPNLNLLAHAQCIELDIGSRCGGHGVCGGDKIQIPLGDLSFFSPPTEHEKKHLSKEQLQQGIRLACQCFPNSSDISTELKIISS